MFSLIILQFDLVSWGHFDSNNAISRYFFGDTLDRLSLI